jgi:hypothetical protein
VHDDGTVYVAGRASVRVQTGGTPRKPTYSFFHRWYMRSSSNGGASWTNHDVYPASASTSAPDAFGVTTDQSGNAYVAGSFAERAIVRTNAGGSWSTSDDFQLFAGQYSAANCMARDSAGTVYFGGVADQGPPDYTAHWIVRSMSPAAAHGIAGGGGSIFADSQIADSNDDRLVELV